jgi:hypothetical protein
MSAPVLVLLVIASAVLVVEFTLTAAAGLALLPQGIERFSSLTGITPSPVTYRLLGVLALAAVIAILAGIWWPSAALVGAAYCAALALFTLGRQLMRGQRGRELFAYSLFLASALVVIVIRAVEVAS